MKHLTKIVMKNFMCYEQETSFEFSPGVNAIIGRNDGGKSTILAAISWVVFGRPAGNTVMSWNEEKDTFVRLYFADGAFVERSRVKEINFYHYSFQNNDPQELRAMGQTVPEEITSLLQLQDINFQGQANNLFPMQLTPAELGLSINRYCQLGDMHETIKRLTTEVTRDQAQHNRNGEELLSLQEKIDATKWAVKAEGKLQSASILLNKLSHKEQACAASVTLISAIEETKQKGYRVGKKRDFLKKKTQTAKNEWENLKVLENDIANVFSLMEKIENTQKRLSQIQRVLSCGKKIRACQFSFSKLRALKEKLRTAMNIQRDIAVCTLESQKHMESKIWALSIIGACRNELPPICPLCGGKRRK